MLKWGSVRHSTILSGDPDDVHAWNLTGCRGTLLGAEGSRLVWIEYIVRGTSLRSQRIPLGAFRVPSITTPSTQVANRHGMGHIAW